MHVLRRRSRRQVFGCLRRCARSVYSTSVRVRYRHTVTANARPSQQSSPSTALLTALNFGRPVVENFLKDLRVARANMDHVSPMPNHGPFG